MSSKISRHIVFAIFGFAISAITAHPLSAQVLYGSLVGTVTDSTGAAVTGVKVDVLNTATGNVKTATTSERGGFTVSDLPAGDYRVTVTAPGFGTLVQRGVDIENNTIRRLDSVLQLAQVAQTVDVSVAAIAMQTDRTDVNAQITQSEVENLPTSTARNFQSLLRTVPGSSPPANSHSVASNPQVALQFNINGGGTANNLNKIDGATNEFFWLPEDAAYVPPQEAIEAVSIVINAFDAEQGLGSASVTNVTLKSGTNKFHGSAWEFNTISNLQAKGYFFAGSRLPKNILNQFGVALGGPILKNKLFFFGDWEHTAQRSTISTYLTLPTSTLASGNFSGTGTTIYDPNTGTSTGTGRQQFLTDMIPANRISSAAAQILALLPAPNVPNVTTNNYFANGNLALTKDDIDGKITFIPNSKSQYFGSFSISSTSLDDPNALGAAGGGAIDGGQPGHSPGHVHRISLGGDYIFTPHLVVDGVFAYARDSILGANTDIGQDYGSNVLGIPGTNSGFPAGNDLDGGIPGFLLTGFSSLGDTNQSSPFYFRDNNYASNLNLSWTKGSHSLRFGGEYDFFEIANVQANISGYGARGGFTFSGGATSLPGGSSTTLYNSLADFELGLPTAMGEDHQFFDPSVVRENIYGLYARDQWQPIQSLTLTYGIRYEFYPSPTRDHGLGGLRYDPTSNLVYLGGVNGVPKDAGVNTGIGNLGPRLGVNYRIGNNTVLRGGFGMNTNSEIYRENAQSFPAVVSAQYSGATSYTPAGSLVTGIPAFTGPNVSAGSFALPTNFGTYTYPANYRRGYVENANVFIERNLPTNIVFQVGYVHSHGIRLDSDVNINAAAPGTGKAGQPLYQAFGNASSIYLVEPLLSSDYNGLQTTARRKIGRTGNIGASYTYSKALSSADNNGESTLSFNYAPAIYRNYSLTGFDRKHNFELQATYDLPFGKGEQFLTHGVAGAIAGGWTVNTILSRDSGTPFSVTASATSLNAPGNSQFANQLIPHVKILGGHGPNNPYFDPNAYAPVTTATFGNSGRDSIRGPGLFDLDASLFRNFAVRDWISIQLRAEAFSVTNTPQFANPSANVSNATFVNGAVTAYNGYDTITSAGGQRQLRFAAKVLF